MSIGVGAHWWNQIFSDYDDAVASHVGDDPLPEISLEMS